MHAWQTANLSNTSACSELAELIKQYSSTALTAYSNDPESLSIMFLTAMEMWICLDQMATRHEPMLLDYETHFPLTSLEPLLLPTRLQSERLLAVEKHITNRQTQTKHGYPSIFSSCDAENSFPVRYFDQSSKMQQLRAKIEISATRVREEKLQEFQQLNNQQAELKAKAQAASCDEISKWNWDWRTGKSEESKVHSWTCQKCAWSDQAEALRIDVHEWPLPSNDSQAKAAVFWLACPKIISLWRDSTYWMLVNVLTEPSTRAHHAGEGGKTYELRNYIGLSSHFVADSSRIEFSSSTKSFLTTHYKKLKVSEATKSGICVKNGLRYDVYDSETGTLARNCLNLCNIRHRCTQKLPSGPYQCLQYTLGHTQHFPNQIVADQSTCPPEIPIHEFLAFGHLRAGHRLQWQNVALALVDGNLNLNQEATRILVAQAIWQAGPCATTGELALRESHAVLKSISFCADILRSLQTALASTEENWQGATSVHTFITIALRILSLSPHATIRDTCLEFLTRARSVTLAWMRKLTEKYRMCVEDNQKDLWTNSTLEVALACYSTFDVDPQHMFCLLKTGSNIAVLTECAITVHDFCPASTSGVPQQIQTSLRRFSRTAQGMEATLHKILVHDASGLDQSVSRLWTSYQGGSSWRSVQADKHEWVMAETAGSETIKAVFVHYNLLTGSLLVAGSPLSRLPRPYEAHDSYIRLFGNVCFSLITKSFANSCHRK